MCVRGPGGVSGTEKSEWLVPVPLPVPVGGRFAVPVTVSIRAPGAASVRVPANARSTQGKRSVRGGAREDVGAWRWARVDAASATRKPPRGLPQPTRTLRWTSRCEQVVEVAAFEHTEGLQAHSRVRSADARIAADTARRMKPVE